MVELIKSEIEKVLGLWWDPLNAILNYYIQVHDTIDVYTKRSILSTTAKMYDTIGIISYEH